MKIIKNSIIYTVVSFLQQGIGFFLLPLYTSYLTTNDYGIVAVVTSLSSFLSIFYLLSLNFTASRLYYKYQEDKEKIKVLFGSIFIFVSIISILITAILIVFYKYLILTVVHGIDFYPYLFLGLLVVTLNPIYVIFQSTLQARQIGWQYGLNNFLFFLINILLTIAGIVIFKLQAKGVLLANVVTNLIFVIYTFIAFLPQIKLKISKPLLKESLKYSLPLVPHSLSSWTSSMINRILLNNLSSTSEAGIFNIGYLVSHPVSMIATSVNQAYNPWFFEQIELGEKGKNQIIKLSTLIITIISFVSLVINLFSSEVLYFMTTTNYHKAWMVIPILSTAGMFQSTYYIYAVTLLVENSKYVFIVTLCGALVNVILNLLLIPIYGFMGAGFATLITQITTSIVARIISNRVYYIAFKSLKMNLFIGLTVFFSLFVYLPVRINTLFFLTIKFILVIIYVLLVLISFRNEIYYFFNIMKQSNIFRKLSNK